MLPTPPTPGTPLPEIESFTLWCNNQHYEFIGDIFIKMSKKAARIAQSGKTEGVISRPINEEVFKSFCAACELKSFTVNSKNAYELKTLADEWEVLSLEKYINDYIKEKNIATPPPVDYLGTLIQHCENNIENPNDILNVADYINDALRDERFSDLPPEVLFKVCNAADPQKIDNQQLLNFILHLLETNPSNAVPLILLIDFDRLTKDQRSLIFRTSDVHEENIGYFIANAMSSARNKNEAEAKQAEAQLEEDLQKMKESLTKQQEKMADKMKHDQDEQLEQLDQEVEQMSAQIQALNDGALQQQQRIDQNAQNHLSAFKDMKNRLAKIEDLTTNRGPEEHTDKIDKEVSDQMNELKEELDTDIINLANDDARYCQLKQRELKRAIDAEQKRLKQLREEADKHVDDLNETNEDLTDLKATLASKIVRDRLRFDKFIRKVDNRLDLFKEEPGVWGLTPERVSQAEKFINEIEEKIDEFCPIRGKKNEQTTD